ITAYREYTGQTLHKRNSPGKRYAKSNPTHKLQMIKAIKNPLAGLILRMFNLPTGTILINVWIKV
ncbi:hypothetical protein POZ22_23035, partial [Bacteroides uniformis]